MINNRIKEIRKKNVNTVLSTYKGEFITHTRGYTSSSEPKQFHNTPVNETDKNSKHAVKFGRNKYQQHSSISIDKSNYLAELVKKKLT